MSAVSTEISNVCFAKIEDGNDFSSDEAQFSIVGRKPGVHNIENFEEAAIFPSLESDLDEYDIENESVLNVTDLESSSNENCKEVKSGALRRIFKNLTRSSKSEFLEGETESAKYCTSEQDIGENATPENEETNVTECEKTSKESKTSISKAFQKLSGVLSRSKNDKTDSSKQDLKEDMEKRNSLSRRLSNISAHLTKYDKDSTTSKHDVTEEKEKRNSLSRRLSNISAHLPKLSSHKQAETTSLDNQSDENQSDNSKVDSKPSQLKRCPSDKSTTLGKRLSSIGSHFRFRGVSNPGSGEAGNVGDAKVEKDIVELNEKKEIG